MQTIFREWQHTSFPLFRSSLIKLSDLSESETVLRPFSRRAVIFPIVEGRARAIDEMVSPIISYLVRQSNVSRGSLASSGLTPLRRFTLTRLLAR